MNKEQLNEFYKELIGMGFKYHHASLKRGYVSRKIAGIARPYKGKFGEGITVEKPLWTTNQYHEIEYWIKEETKE